MSCLSGPFPDVPFLNGSEVNAEQGAFASTTSREPSRERVIMNRIQLKEEGVVQRDHWRKLAFASHFKPDSLAQLCGVSLRTLQRYFSRNGSVTISQWLQTIRLHEAYSRLKSGARVKEVAYDLGYKQLSHFSREFKKQYGISPSLLNGSKLPSGERVCRVDRVVAGSAFIAEEANTSPLATPGHLASV